MSGNEVLSARNLARYGLRRGAYDGANRRRFCLFCASMFGTGSEERREYDLKAERDAAALRELSVRVSWFHGMAKEKVRFVGRVRVSDTKSA